MGTLPARWFPLKLEKEVTPLELELGMVVSHCVSAEN